MIKGWLKLNYFLWLSGFFRWLFTCKFWKCNQKSSAMPLRIFALLFNLYILTHIIIKVPPWFKEILKLRNFYWFIITIAKKSAALSLSIFGFTLYLNIYSEIRFSKIFVYGMVNSMKWDRYFIGLMKNTAIHILKLIEPMYLYA